MIKIEAQVDKKVRADDRWKENVRTLANKMVEQTESFVIFTNEQLRVKLR